MARDDEEPPPSYAETVLAQQQPRTLTLPPAYVEHNSPDPSPRDPGVIATYSGHIIGRDYASRAQLPNIIQRPPAAVVVHANNAAALAHKRRRRVICTIAVVVCIIVAVVVAALLVALASSRHPCRHIHSCTQKTVAHCLSHPRFPVWRCVNSSQCYVLQLRQHSRYCNNSRH